MSTIKMRPISASETYDLRHRVLRPNQPFSTCLYPCDNELDALHVGCFLNEQLIGVGSILPDPRENALYPISWRVRGMAVVEEARGTGAGGKILQALLDHACSQQLPAEIWCNGRVNVKGYYARFGFKQEGEPFELPGTGPHLLMLKTLSPGQE